MNQGLKGREHTIILVGDSGVGETTLVMRLHEYFAIRILNSRETEIWDLRGGPFHDFLLLDCEKAEIALIVYDVTRPETFFKVNEYLEKIRRKCSTLPMAILGNKIDWILE
ncbi:MAG: hypothetical protein JW779_09575 [Candidatus Thorarchaeota archaeon]|nr:hypothetical protein [Candidatus Thorarchaeota archaeon]